MLGVVVAGDLLGLSNDNVLRPESATRGDGDCPEPSASPASGGLTAYCLPLLTPPCLLHTHLLKAELQELV